MQTNLVSIAFTEEQIAAVTSALSVLETQLASLITLSAPERRELFKMGDKSEVFVRETLAVLLQNPKLMPESLGLPEAQADLKALDDLRPILRRLQALVERGESTELGLGADLFGTALEGYAILKVSGKHHGLEGKRKELSARFAKTRRQPPQSPEA